jgi:hypothetical protein
MKKLIKAIFFRTDKPNKILSGVSSGMLTHYNPNDRTLHLLGLYEREIYPFLLKSIGRADTLIDIGANDGYYGLAFAKRRGKEIILCEPGDEKENLRKNLLLNGFKENRDYALIDKFVSDRTNETNISLNDLMQGKRKVFVLMDVDGGEQQIIENYKFSDDVKVDWLIETHSLQLEENVSSVLTAHGYAVQIIGSAWWRLLFPEKRPLEHNRWMYATKER